MLLMNFSFKNMNFSATCRTCLKNIRLNPIFVSEDNHEIFSSAIYLCTGVQVKLNDGLPQKMCTNCMNQLNMTLKFRKQCKKVETLLIKIKTESESLETNPIVTNEQHTLKVTNNIPNTKQLLTVNKSAPQNCSNVTEIKSEFNIKTELQEIDIDDKPLKFIIHKKEGSISLLNNFGLKKTPSENVDKTDYSPSETDEEEGVEIEKTFLKNTDLPCEDTTDTESFKHVINSRLPQRNYNKNLEQTQELFTELNDSTEIHNVDIKITDTEVNDNNENIKITDSNSTENKYRELEIPYNVVTKSVTEKTARVVCKLCQKELSIRSIDSHMARRHPGADERKVKCELCDKYVMREKLNRHVTMMHGSMGVKCGYCKSEFKSKELLVDHVTTCTTKKRKRHNNDSGKTLAECDICKKTMQRASLNKHKAVKHAGLRPVCEHCGKSFGNKWRLNDHYRAKHGYEKFQCSYCDFRSAGIVPMRNHERRHRGEKPFVCESCGAKFHAAYLLTQHKHSHRTEKLVKCDLCPASFKANNRLHMHKMTCHSNSFYRCTLCSRSYKCKYYAVKHVRLAHNNVSGAPPIIKLMAQ